MLRVSIIMLKPVKDMAVHHDQLVDVQWADSAGINVCCYVVDITTEFIRASSAQSRNPTDSSTCNSKHAYNRQHTRRFATKCESLGVRKCSDSILACNVEQENSLCLDVGNNSICQVAAYRVGPGAGP